MSKNQLDKIPTTPEDVRKLYWETILAMKNRKLEARTGKEVLSGILKLSQEIRAEIKHSVEMDSSKQNLLTPSVK